MLGGLGVIGQGVEVTVVGIGGTSGVLFLSRIGIMSVTTSGHGMASENGF